MKVCHSEFVAEVGYHKPLSIDELQEMTDLLKKRGGLVGLIVKVSYCEDGEVHSLGRF